MRIRFLGAVGTVTGSKYLVSTDTTNILVDCGLYQGLKELRLRNWRELPIDLASLDAIVLTHAHIDHSGFVPALVKQGFTGPIYCSGPTRALCEVLLPDCGRINEEDAQYANKKGFSKHHPALPIYTEVEARQSLKYFKTMAPRREMAIGDLSVTLHEVGHILGACSLTVKHGAGSVVFSGDIGRYNDLVENAPMAIPGAEWVVMETTYGDRLHGEDDPIQAIADAVQNTSHRGGMVLIPSFAVGRTQSLLYCISQALKRGYMPPVPIYVDSPMATQVTKLYETFCDWHRLSPEGCSEVWGPVRFVSTVEESKRLNNKTEPMVIVSASGMLTGGRVLHHLKARGGNPNNTILLAGFQAAGTRGATLAAGNKQVKVHGEMVNIAAEVLQFDMFSAHADRDELIRWLDSHERKPTKIFLTHGEEKSRDAFKALLEARGSQVVSPEYNAEFEI